MKRLLSLLLSLTVIISLSVPAFAAGPSFLDVSQSYWAYQFVEQAAEEGWVSGVGNGKFNPNGKVTGAEWYTMVIRAFFPDKIPDEAPASQWYSGKWYAPYAAAGDQLEFAERLDDYATSQDIAERPLTRAEMAAVIFKVLSWYDVQAPEDKLLEAEQSIPDINNYALEDGRRGPIIKCYALGILAGTDSKGTFNGEADMTRAQAAVTLCRLADVIEAKENGTLPGPDDKPDPKPDPEPGDQTTANVPTEAEAYDAIMALQQDYPQGMSWTNDNTWYDDKGNSRGKGCVAFAALCQYTAFGDVPGHYVDSLDDVKVGDSIRIGNYSPWQSPGDRRTPERASFQRCRSPAAPRPHGGSPPPVSTRCLYAPPPPELPGRDCAPCRHRSTVRARHPFAHQDDEPRSPGSFPPGS